MAPTGRRRDVLDEHIDQAERIRRLELMGQSRVLRPRVWRPHEPERTREELLTELVADMSYWHTLLDTDPDSGALGPQVSLSREAQGLRAILRSEGWGGYGYDWTRFLVALKAVPPSPAALVFDDAPEAISTGAWAPELPAPSALLAGPVALFSTHDYTLDMHAKWLAWAGYTAGRYEWKPPNINLGISPLLLKPGQRNPPATPNLGESVIRSGRAFQLAPLGSYVYEPGSEAALSYIQIVPEMDSSMFYYSTPGGPFGDPISELRSCENSLSGRHHPSYDPAVPHGVPYGGVLGIEGCDANLVDHEVDVNGMFVLYEANDPHDLTLVYPPVQAHGQPGVAAEEPDVVDDYPGWTELLARVTALLPLCPGVAAWFFAQEGRVRPSTAAEVAAPRALRAHRRDRRGAGPRPQRLSARLCTHGGWTVGPGECATRSSATSTRASSRRPSSCRSTSHGRTETGNRCARHRATRPRRPDYLGLYVERIEGEDFADEPDVPGGRASDHGDPRRHLLSHGRDALLMAEHTVYLSGGPATGRPSCRRAVAARVVRLRRPRRHRSAATASSASSARSGSPSGCPTTRS